MKKIITSNGKPLIQDGKVFLSSGGGSNIIEVTEFPTENVQDFTFYKKISKTNTEVYAVIGGGAVPLSSMGAFIYEVDTLPSDMQVSDVENNIFYLYVYESKAYFYDGSKVMTFGEFYISMGMELPDRGSVESIDQMTNDGIYVIYGKEIKQIGVNNKTYNFVDGVWNDYYDLFFGIMNCTIETLETPLIETLRNNICANCMTLKYVNLSNCKIVGENVFNNCFSLREVRLPICEQIGYNAFFDTGDVQLYLGLNNIVSIMSSTFSEGNHNLVAHVRPELLSAYESDTNWASAVSNGYITLVGDYTD